MKYCDNDQTHENGAQPQREAPQKRPAAKARGRSFTDQMPDNALQGLASGAGDHPTTAPVQVNDASQLSSGGFEPPKRTDSGSKRPFDDLMQLYGSGQASGQTTGAASGQETCSPHDFAAFGKQSPTTDLPHRETLESAYGGQLGHIKVHQGDHAQAATDGLNANAFMHQGAIVLGQGTDLRTIAEEVAHVKQFERGGGLQSLTDPASPVETHAAAAADAVIAGQPVGDVSGGLGSQAIARSSKPPPDSSKTPASDEQEQEAAAKAAADAAHTAVQDVKAAKSGARSSENLNALLAKIPKATSAVQKAAELNPGQFDGMEGELKTIATDASSAIAAISEVQAAVEENKGRKPCDPALLQGQVTAISTPLGRLSSLFPEVANHYNFAHNLRLAELKAEQATELAAQAAEVVSRGTPEIDMENPGPEDIQQLVARQQELVQVQKLAHRLVPPKSLTQELARVRQLLSERIHKTGMPAADMLSMQDQYDAEIGLSQNAEGDYGVKVGTKRKLGALQEGHHLLAHTHPDAETDPISELAGHGDVYMNKKGKGPQNVQGVVHARGMSMFGPKTRISDAGSPEDADLKRSADNVVTIDSTELNLRGQDGSLVAEHTPSKGSIAWGGQGSEDLKVGAQVPQDMVQHHAHTHRKRKPN